METAPVAVLSAFGRGHAFAQGLLSSDIPVVLLDVGSLLGRSTLEDDEGPFGFVNSHFTQAEVQRFMGDYAVHLQEKGMVCVFEDGPFETKGPISQLRRHDLEIPDKLWELWLLGQSLQQPELSYLMNSEFDEVWFFHFMRALTANQWVPNYRAGLVGGGLSYNSDYFLRSPSRKNAENSLTDLAGLNMKIFNNARVRDISISAKGVVEGLEIFDDQRSTSVFQACSKLVSFLSSVETEKLGLAKKVFVSGVEEPLFCWVRCRIEIPESTTTSQLPEMSIWVKNRLLSWSHENLFVLRRTSNMALYDLWLKVPAFHRVQSDYLRGISEKCIKFLCGRLNCQNILLQEIENWSETTARHPVYEYGVFESMKSGLPRNFHWAGPETWDGLGINFLSRRAHQVNDEILNWWKLLQSKSGQEKARMERT